jgi:hypothetical protein
MVASSDVHEFIGKAERIQDAVDLALAVFQNSAGVFAFLTALGGQVNLKALKEVDLTEDVLGDLHLVEFFDLAVAQELAKSVVMLAVALGEYVRGSICQLAKQSTDAGVCRGCFGCGGISKCGHGFFLFFSGNIFCLPHQGGGREGFPTLQFYY